MSRLQIAVISLLTVMILCLISAGAFAGKTVVDGLSLRRTRIAVEFVRMSWRHRNFAAVGKGLLNSTSTALEGGLRLQLSNYYLERSTAYQNDGQLSEAARSCLTASAVLGKYETGTVYQECTNTYWDKPDVDYWRLAAQGGR